MKKYTAWLPIMDIIYYSKRMVSIQERFFTAKNQNILIIYIVDSCGKAYIEVICGKSVYTVRF